MMNVIELSCYLFLYSYIKTHNSTVAVNILDPVVINMRNRVNSISLTGHVACWVLEIGYFAIIGIFSVLRVNVIRDVFPYIKIVEYFLVPLIQIKTSPSINTYVQAKTN